MIKKNTTLTKVCGIAYDIDDIKRVIEFSNSRSFKWYYIYHNGANDEEKEDNHKEHYHFVIESDTQHRFLINSLITETFGINLFQKCTNVDAYLRYMTHIDYVDKEKYSYLNIISNVESDIIKSRIEKASVDLKEIDTLNFETLVDLILDGSFHNFRHVMIYCRQNNISYKMQWTNTLMQLLKCGD